MASVGNSMSTTGPMTREIRPTEPAAPEAFVSSTVAVMSLTSPHSLLAGVRVGKGVDATDDLAEFLGTASLAGLVGDSLVLLDELVGVVRGRLHRLLTGCQLGGGSLQQGEEDAALDVAREQ